MSFFPQALYGANQGFTPLFRLLDDFDSYSRGGNGRHQRNFPTFHPKFDVRETETGYELHGELPGLEKKDVRIEFTDPQTLVVRGSIERSYSAGTPPAGFVEGGEGAKQITEGGEGTSKKSRQATVEDEGQATPSTTDAEVVKGESKPADKAKYWVTERSIGEFSRSFSFPGRVDQDAVSANLKDGILSIVVPKAKKHEARRIAIE